MLQDFDYFVYMYMLDPFVDDDQGYDYDDYLYDLKKRLMKSEGFLRKNVFIVK